MTELQKSIIINMNERLGKSFNMGGVIKNSNYTYEEASKMIEANKSEYEKLPKIVWQVSSIELLLTKNISFVIKSLLRLVNNKFEFDKYESPFMIDIVNKYKSNGELTKSQFEFIQIRLKKYTKELTNLANELDNRKCKVVEY